MVKKFDFLVIGSGIAGMSFALKVAHKGKVALICKSGLEEANTYFAQGGVASVTNLLVDNFDKHIEDTMIAGDWISDRAAVEKVVREAPAQIEALINWEWILIKMKKASSTCTAKEGTRNSAFSTTKTIPAPKYRTVLSEPYNGIPILRLSKIISPLRY